MAFERVYQLTVILPHIRTDIDFYTSLRHIETVLAPLSDASIAGSTAATLKGVWRFPILDGIVHLERGVFLGGPI